MPENSNLRSEETSTWINDLYRIMSLSEDWDGLGAVAPSPLALRAAIELLEQLVSDDVPPPDRVLPTPMGAILIEWQRKEAYLEATVTRTGAIEWMLESPPGSYEHWESPSPLPPVSTDDSAWNPGFVENPEVDSSSAIPA